MINNTNSKNQRLGSAFDDLDLRLFGQQVGDMSPDLAKSVGDARYASQDPFVDRSNAIINHCIYLHIYKYMTVQVLKQTL